MNFVFVGLPYYDYMQATVVQGLQKLGHRCLGFGQDSRNYMEPFIPNNNVQPDVFVYAPQDLAGDINIDGSHIGMIKILLWVHDRILPDHINEFNPHHYKYDMAFVRELMGEYDNVYPINFGIEDRFYEFTNGRIRGLGLRPWDITFLGNTAGNYPHAAKRLDFTNHIEHDFKGYCLNLGRTEADPNSSYDYVVNGRHRHYSAYFKQLSRSKIGLCLHGAGQDCARTWEVAASGAVPAIQRYTIRHVEPWWKDGVNCFEFDTYEEFRDKAKYYLTEEMGKIKLLNMQMRAWAFGRTHHRTEHRAQYILEKLQYGG